MYTLRIHIIINAFNHIVYTYEYQPMCLGQSDYLTPFSAILGCQRPRCKNLSKYTPLVFLSFPLRIYDFNNIFET